MAGVVSFVWIRLPRADLWFGELQHPEHEVSHCFAGLNWSGSSPRNVR